MLQEKPKICCLSNNMLKIIGAVSMVCDHMGVILFPEAEILRIIGRLAFPIFAFLIAEGAKYTRNKLRHFLMLSLFAGAIQLVYSLYLGSTLEMNVMVTFTLSLLIIYALDALKIAIFEYDTPLFKKIFCALAVIGVFLIAIIADAMLDLDYGLSGALVPVFPAICTTPKVKNPPEYFKWLDTPLLRVCVTALGILALAIDDGDIQYYSLFVIPILLLYSGQRGKYKMKYFFYIFYPLHLGILWLIAMLLAG